MTRIRTTIRQRGECHVDPFKIKGPRPGTGEGNRIGVYVSKEGKGPPDFYVSVSHLPADARLQVTAARAERESV